MRCFVRSSCSGLFVLAAMSSLSRPVSLTVGLNRAPLGALPDHSVMLMRRVHFVRVLIVRAFANAKVGIPLALQMPQSAIGLTLALHLPSCLHVGARGAFADVANRIGSGVGHALHLQAAWRLTAAVKILAPPSQPLIERQFPADASRLRATSLAVEFLVCCFAVHWTPRNEKTRRSAGFVCSGR